MSIEIISRHGDYRYRDAIRLSLQSAVAAALTFSVMQSLGLNEKFVGVLSAALVVQPSLGTALGAGGERFIATLVGCIVGILCMFMLPDGYGTAGALAISMLVMNGIAAFRPEWRYGVVAAVALALGSDADVIQTALERSIAIGAGVVMGILVSLIVWPERSVTRAGMHIQHALRAAADLLESRVSRTNGEETEDDDEAGRRFLKELSSARETTRQIRIADNETLKKKIDAVERFQHGITVLDRIAEQSDNVVGGQESIAEELEEFRSLSSTIIRRLASGDGGSREEQESLGHCVEKLRDIVSTESSPAESHVRRNALVYALDEVQSSLDRLLDLYAES